MDTGSELIRLDKLNIKLGEKMNIKLMNRCFLVTLSFFLCQNCDDSSDSTEFDSSFNVRVINSMSDAINIEIGPSAFGLLAPNDTTGYKPVYMGMND